MLVQVTYSTGDSKVLPDLKEGNEISEFETDAVDTVTEDIVDVVSTNDSGVKIDAEGKFTVA